jgi:RNase H-fold protein (predicted Holliday junction resolvase)
VICGRKQKRRVLGIALSSRGFGYALLEGKTLADWGAKTFYRDKNESCLKHIDKLMEHYAPDVLVVEDVSAKNSRRSARVRQLSEQLIASVQSRDVKTVPISRQNLLRTFLANSKGSKHDFAQAVTACFPEELGIYLPPKRRLWMSEDYRMAIFDAVAFAFINSG